jgi:hypothetical protein
MRLLLVVVGIALLAIVHCGGSETTDDGGTPGASATSAKTLNAMNTFSSLMQTVGTAIMSNGQGANVSQSVKTVYTAGNTTCDWTFGSNWEFECAIRDGINSTGSGYNCGSEEEGCCDVVGHWQDPQSVDWDFVMDYDCTNYQPANELAVDGNYSVTWTWKAMPVTQMSASVAKMAKQTTNGDCAIDPNLGCDGQEGTYSYGGITCEIDCSSNQACTELLAYFLLIIEVGDRDLALTDECGTYTWLEGARMSGRFCMDQVNYTSGVTFNVTGTYVGPDGSETYDANDNMNITCDYSGALD